MEKEIKIEAPKGYEIDKENSTLECIRFKEVKSVKNYDDVAEKLFLNKKTYYIDDEAETESTEAYIDWVSLANNSTTKEQLESILALNKLCNVAKYLNGDWLPEDSAGNNYYLDINSKNSLDVFNAYCASGHVCFKHPELAKQAIEILGEEEIKKALTLNH